MATKRLDKLLAGPDPVPTGNENIMNEFMCSIPKRTTLARKDERNRFVDDDGCTCKI